VWDAFRLKREALFFIDIDQASGFSAGITAGANGLAETTKAGAFAQAFSLTR
jgi:hypothetical protein